MIAQQITVTDNDSQFVHQITHHRERKLAGQIN
jgi:hypothetical protein